MERFANNPIATLVLPLDTVTTSVSVDDASDFPTDGTFRLAVGDELMMVNSVAGNTFTVVRGAEGTTATNHAVATGVTSVLTAGSIAQLKNDIASEGTYASRPVAGNEGALYFHEGGLSRDNGSDWEEYGPMRKVTPPGNFTSWAYGRQSTFATLNSWGAGQFYFDHQPGETSEHKLNTYVRPMANTTVFAIEAETTIATSSSQGNCGLCFRDAGKIYSVMLDITSSRWSASLWYHATEDGTAGTQRAEKRIASIGASMFLRLAFDNNRVTAEASSGYGLWTSIGSYTDVTFNPTECGIVTGAGASGNAQMSVTDWREIY